MKSTTEMSDAAAGTVAAEYPIDTIGVIGHGFVGKAVARAFKGYTDVKVWDRRPERATHTLVQVLKQQVVFICLPTPLAPAGAADLSAIQELLAAVEGSSQTLVLMSTVPPGTTDDLAKRYRLRGLVHSPAFMTARTNLVDFEKPSRLLIGAPRKSCQAAMVLTRVYGRRFPECPLLLMRPTEAELAKYICNCFFAVKISYFNEMRAISRQLCCRWDYVMEGVLADPRIGRSHTLVPGPDGKAGFGSNLLKDMPALIGTAQDAAVHPHVLIGAWHRNAESRTPVLGPGIGSNF
jgi:UDPglucose 6-dehydrogenase